MSQEFVDAQLKRSRFLLSPEAAKTTLIEMPPALEPAQLGAVGGTDFKAQDVEMAVSVYVFDNPTKQNAAVEQLRASVAGQDGLYTVSGINGPLLLWGYTKIDKPDGVKAKYKLAKIASAFAGEE